MDKQIYKDKIDHKKRKRKSKTGSRHINIRGALEGELKKREYITS